MGTFIVGMVFGALALSGIMTLIEFYVRVKGEEFDQVANAEASSNKFGDGTDHGC